MLLSVWRSVNAWQPVFLFKKLLKLLFQHPYMLEKGEGKVKYDMALETKQLSFSAVFAGMNFCGHRYFFFKRLSYKAAVWSDWPLCLKYSPVQQAALQRRKNGTYENAHFAVCVIFFCPIFGFPAPGHAAAGHSSAAVGQSGACAG